MKKLSMMSWNDRFAIIDQFKPSDNTICDVFNLTSMELHTASRLRAAGTFAPNPHLNTTQFAELFNDIDNELSLLPVVNVKISSVTVHNKPETATKKVIVKEIQKRGRTGNKIQQALFAVPNTPVPVDQFIQEHGVSVAVLRQSKRFTEHLSVNDRQLIGKICVKQDKTTKILMIWKEIN